MNWLPAHKCGLYIEHNAHKNVYEAAHEYYDKEDFISEDEWVKAMWADSVWTLQWYPDTPIGSYKLAASSLDAIKKALEEKEYDS